MSCKYVIIIARGEIMVKNLLYVLTYISAFLISTIIMLSVYRLNPSMSEATANLWLQILVGISGFVLYVGIFRKYVKQQLEDLQSRRTDIILIGVIGFFLMYLGAIILNVIVMELSSTDQAGNQAAIEGMFNGLTHFELFMLVTTITVFTPIAEEFAFRKGLYGFFGKLTLWFGNQVNPGLSSTPDSPLFKTATVVAIVGSGLVFGLIHVVGPGDYVYLISYGGAGIMLGMIYHFSGRNIFATIIAHILQNSLAVLFMFLI